MPLVLVRFPDMVQVDAAVHEDRASKDSVKLESDESILVVSGRLAVIRQCLEQGPNFEPRTLQPFYISSCRVPRATVVNIPRMLCGLR